MLALGRFVDSNPLLNLGHGRFARGGRGGRVVEVTNLNDSGPGSLREALTILEDLQGVYPNQQVLAQRILELRDRIAKRPGR